jgi:hypothetical protein
MPVKYKELCTTLPSSAPVERLFSEAVQVYTARRNRLDDKDVRNALTLHIK